MPDREAEEAAIAAWLIEHQAITKPGAKPAPALPTSNRGRPRAAGERYPSGELRREPDGGTVEHQARREHLVGPARDTRTPQRIAKHEALASYPLGVLYARRIILQGDHYAGRRYAALFSLAVRPLAIASVLGNLAAGPMASALVDEATAVEKHPLTGALVPIGTVAREKYLAAHAILEALGPHVVRAVDNVAVYEHPPRGPKQLDALRTGLDALFRHFEGEDARSRAARAA